MRHDAKLCVTDQVWSGSLVCKESCDPPWDCGTKNTPPPPPIPPALAVCLPVSKCTDTCEDRLTVPLPVSKCTDTCEHRLTVPLPVSKCTDTCEDSELGISAL